jgi:hypothetical protein
MDFFQRLLEIPDPRFPRVSAGDLEQGLFRILDVRPLEPRVFEGFGYEIAFGDGEFFLVDVTGKLITSIRSRRGLGMVSRVLAVVMKRMFEMSKGRSR